MILRGPGEGRGGAESVPGTTKSEGPIQTIRAGDAGDVDKSGDSVTRVRPSHYGGRRGVGTTRTTSGERERCEWDPRCWRGSLVFGLDS